MVTSTHGGFGYGFLFERFATGLQVLVYIIYYLHLILSLI